MRHNCQRRRFDTISAANWALRMSHGLGFLGSAPSAGTTTTRRLRDCVMNDTCVTRRLHLNVSGPQMSRTLLRLASHLWAISVDQVPNLMANPDDRSGPSESCEAKYWSSDCRQLEPPTVRTREASLGRYSELQGRQLSARQPTQ